jgi:sugar/nucleoside kinase (ribokinase family)
MVQPFDIAFVGHTYRDRIVHADKPPVLTVGGALVYGSIAAARAGGQVAVVTKMAEADRSLLADVDAAGVRCHVTPVPFTSELEVIYPTADTERRDIFIRRQAPPFALADLPDLRARTLHLAGNANGEFPLIFVRALRQPGRRLGLDMQGFVRQPDPQTHAVRFGDVTDKREIAGALDALKLDAVEAEILTGQSNPVTALAAMADWGCPEIVLTKADGVLGRFGGKTFFARFTNRNSAGRNGRGDTVFASYLLRRLTHPPEEALAFAAALVSIKLESPGPFAGSLDDVLARLRSSPPCQTL